MKKSIIFGSIVIVSLVLLSCGGTSSCTSTEEKDPDDLTISDNMDILSNISYCLS